MDKNNIEKFVEQKLDPDFRLKRLEEFNGMYHITCSKCHHCK